MTRTSTPTQRLIITALLVALAALALPGAASAGGLTEADCIDDGGSYTDLGSTATCLFPKGSVGYADYGVGCNYNVLVFIDDADEVTGTTCDIGPPPLAYRLHCARIDLPRTIQQQAGHPISFKGGMHVATAALRLSGYDSDAPINNLTYDFAAKTWSGDFHSYLIPVGTYENVRVIITNDSGVSKACNIGRLTVES